MFGYQFHSLVIAHCSTSRFIGDHAYISLIFGSHSSIKWRSSRDLLSFHQYKFHSVIDAMWREVFNIRKEFPNHLSSHPTRQWLHPWEPIRTRIETIAVLAIHSFGIFLKLIGIKTLLPCILRSSVSTRLYTTRFISSHVNLSTFSNLRSLQSVSRVLTLRVNSLESLSLGSGCLSLALPSSWPLIPSYVTLVLKFVSLDSLFAFIWAPTLASLAAT